MKNPYYISSENPPKASELLNLFHQTSWAKTRSLNGVKALLDTTQIFVAVRKDDILIGYGRAISDGIYRALIDDIIIDENYREKGLGREIMSILMEKLKHVDEIILTTRAHLEEFYKNLGFQKAKGLTMKKYRES